MTPLEQLELWIKGQDVHNHERYYDVVDESGKVVDRKKLQGGECCPDFSCCHPEGKWPQETRDRFYKAFIDNDETLQHEMLMMALGGLVTTSVPDRSVYVCGQDLNSRKH